MFKIWCKDIEMGLPTIINISKETKEQAIKEFNRYYKSKYEFLNAIECKNNKCA